MIRDVLKIVGIVLLALILLIVILFVKAALTPMVPKEYFNKVSTGGVIEEKYLADGGYAVKYVEYKTDEDFQKYEIWYPAELEIENSQYPLIVMLNGTGVKASKYEEQFKHFASWGFIVIGTEEEESWDGVAADKSLELILNENENVSSVFYHKVDIENIGAMGHSQGGAGVFNAITEMNHSGLYKAAISLSPTNEEQSIALNWHYDLSKISIPILVLAGTEGDFEMKLVLPEETMHNLYNKIHAPKVMARKLGCEHGEMLYSADGYNTAWFMWQLNGDLEAATAFTGDSPELLNNELYIEQKVDE